MEPNSIFNYARLLTCVALIAWLPTGLGVLRAADHINWPQSRPVNESKLWQRPIAKGLQSDASAKLAPIFQYQFLLPERPLSASLSFYGAAVRLRKFVTDLLRGSRPLKVGVAGGSISAGKFASTPGVDDWFSVVTDWLASVSPANVTARNGALGGTPSAYMVLCHQYYIDPDVDLVFVEYACNDGLEEAVLNNTVTMSEERLLRLLLTLPGRPAVVLVEAPPVGLTDLWQYYKTGEHLQGSNAAYYDIPVVSPHTALHQVIKQHPAEGWEFDKFFVSRHPGTAGHKAMADAVANLLQRTALDLVHRPLTDAELEMLDEPLPDPMHPGNVPPTTTTCSVGPDLQQLAKLTSGWSWVNEGSEQQPKWGFVSEVPGSRLQLEFDSVRSNLATDVRVPVMIYFLMSYTNMGWARMECVSGCACKPVDFDAHLSAHVSQTYMGSLVVSQAAVCRIQMTVLDKTSSGGHKFKVQGVVVTDQPESAPLLHPGHLKFPETGR